MNKVIQKGLNVLGDMIGRNVINHNNTVKINGVTVCESEKDVVIHINSNLKTLEVEGDCIVYNNGTLEKIKAGNNIYIK